MKEVARDPACNLSRGRAAAVLAFFALSFTVYLIRIVSVWRYGALFCSTAVESPMIDSVWRCMHHRPVYGWPFAFPFFLSLYNYLFYYAYASVLRLTGAWDVGILTWGRQLTLLFALAGAIAQWRLVRSLLSLRGASSALSLSLALGLWLCSSLIKYWALTIRPDMAALALVMIALWVIVRHPRYCFVYAAILLYLAWAFKQSVVLAFVSLCFWLLFNKRWRDLSMLVATFGLLVTATLLVGSPEYRFSILIAPQMVKGFAFGIPWILHALGTGATAVLLNIYWVAAPIVLVRASGGVHRVDSKLRPLMIVFTFALIVGLAGMGKVGGTSNYLFEAFAAGSTLLQVAVFTMPGRLVTYLILIGCVQPALQIAGVVVGYHVPGKRDMVPIATAAEYADAMALRERLAVMKKPIFTTDGAFELPWISTDDGAPALVIDPNFQEVARAREQNGGIEGMLQRGEIPTVMLSPSDLVSLKSLNPNYRKVGESIQQGVTYSIYEFNAETSALAH
ncbi:MAG: hypothetical protein ABSE51_02090 [Terracidiphilus sp.]|jgi:hypothetical protein